MLKESGLECCLRNNIGGGAKHGFGKRRLAGGCAIAFSMIFDAVNEQRPVGGIQHPCPCDRREAGHMKKRSINRERAITTDDQMAKIPQSGEGPRK
jgi:hypothetical protein